MWLALTNEQFKNMAFYDIDPFWRRSLEGDYDQVYTLGPNQWLGKKVICVFEISTILYEQR